MTSLERCWLDHGREFLRVCGLARRVGCQLSICWQDGEWLAGAWAGETPALTVRLADGAITSHDEPALAEQQTLEVGRLGRKVAEHLGYPADIEWAIASGELALLQARAIRGLDVQIAAERLLEEERKRLTESAAGKSVVWVAHNLGETLPAPTLSPR